MRIALLEDDAAQAELVHSWLQGSGHSCSVYNTGRDFVFGLQHSTFDMLILDWNLPDTNGVETLEWVRRHTSWRIPVIFITCRDAEHDVVLALGQGADDYMTKPVKRLETLARISALERRSHPQPDVDGAVRMPPYVFDLHNRTIFFDGESVDVTQKEFELALFLFRHSGRLLSRSHILENVWGVRAQVQTRTVDMHISRLRNKMKIQPTNGWRLSAVYQHGYRLEAVDTRDS